MASVSADTRRDIESFVVDWLSDHRIPGAALSIVEDDAVIFSEGFGARSLEDNAAVTEHTLFGIGSCTKSFTAIAIMQLVESGDLALEDPVDNYLPHLADVPGDPITLEELLTHTSGMPSDVSAGPLITRPLGLGHIEVPLSSKADFRRFVQGTVDRRVTDRETFFYYNSGYTMLGLIVEAVTDTSFAEYVTDHITQPAGMDRTTFHRDSFEGDTDRMTPYVKQEGQSTEAGFPFDSLIHAPGGLVSSADEMATYLRLYLNEGIVNGHRILESDSLEAMTTPVGTFGSYLDGREIGYGFGLMVEDFLSDRLIGHGGSIAVSNAWFGYLEDAGIGVALVCTTGAEAHPMVVGPAVLAIMDGRDPTDIVPHYRLVGALSRVEGTYENYRSIGTANVERVDGALKIEFESGLGGQELLAVPTAVDDRLVQCTAVSALGIEHQVRFDLDDSSIDMFFERSRLTKTT